MACAAGYKFESVSPADVSACAWPSALAIRREGQHLTSGKRLIFSAVATALTGALALGGAELIVRLSGHRPWRYLGADAKEPTISEPDPELGWRLKAGDYIIPPYAPASPSVYMTVLDGGRRATGPAPPQAVATIAFIGCSFTQGWAISDEETFAWRVQERFPSLQVLNLGVGGYGTYQSLLALERLLAAPDPQPQAVLYGFIQQHEVRNVAPPGWLRHLAMYSKRGMVAVPYCTLDDDGRLVRHPPERHPQWPLREQFAALTLLQETHARLRGKARSTQARAVTQQLMLEMQRLCARHGIRFTVVFLQASPHAKRQYSEFLAQEGIHFFDCEYPFSPDMKVRGEGHPNGQMNALWASCLAAQLETYEWTAPTLDGSAANVD